MNHSKISYKGADLIMGQIFRDKSIKRVDQPEDLSDYIRVTTPSVWIVLIGIVLVLVAILGWMIFGTVDVHNDDGTVTETHPITYVTN